MKSKAIQCRTVIFENEEDITFMKNSFNLLMTEIYGCHLYFIKQSKILRGSWARTRYHSKSRFFRLIKGRVTYRFSYALRHNDANKMTPHPTPLHMRHCQIFGKIDSFLKPVLNIFILRILIVRWENGLLKRGMYFTSNL